MRPPRPARRRLPIALTLLLLLVGLSAPLATAHAAAPASRGSAPLAATNGTAVANFSGALSRLVALVAAGGGALLALVWARVALSWFSNDVSKKVLAKDRARDALIGTLIFTAAISGLFWVLAQWVITGA